MTAPEIAERMVWDAWNSPAYCISVDSTSLYGSFGIHLDLLLGELFLACFPRVSDWFKPNQRMPYLAQTLFNR